MVTNKELDRRLEEVRESVVDYYKMGRDRTDLLRDIVSQLIDLLGYKVAYYGDTPVVRKKEDK